MDTDEAGGPSMASMCARVKVTASLPTLCWKRPSMDQKVAIVDTAKLRPMPIFSGTVSFCQQRLPMVLTGEFAAAQESLTQSLSSICRCF